MSLKKTIAYIVSHPLSKGRVLSNLCRFAVWQFRSRLSSAASIFGFVAPTRLYARRGMTSATGHLYVGLQEFEDMSFVIHVLRAEDLFLDVGANIGAYTVLATAVAGADAIAFEPAVESRVWLERNVTLNGMDRKVSVRREAVGANAGEVRFSKGRDTTNAVLKADEPGDMVPLTTLDEACFARAPTLIKIDVEGFETEVIKGSRAVLKNPALLGIVMELNGAGQLYGFSDTDLAKELLAHGFRMYSYAPFERCLVPLRRLEDRGAGQDNVIFVRDSAAVEARLASAKRFRVRGWTI